MYKNNKWSNEELEFLKNNYLVKSNSELAKILNRTVKAVQVKLSKMDLRRPDKYSYNKEFFKDINSAEKAYWLGFMYADGYVTIGKTNAEIAIELNPNDAEHLKKFNKSLEGNVPINYREHKSTFSDITKTVNIRLYSREMAEDLIKNGCYQNKTFKIKFPDFIATKFLWDFVRGYFDGDGSIYLDKQRKFISFNFTCGSKEFIFGLKDFLNNNGIYAYYTEDNRKDNKFKEQHTRYKLLINGMNNAYCFGEKLYQNSELFLNRKREKYELLKKNFNIEERIKKRPYRR